MNKLVLSIILFTFFFISKTALPDNCAAEAAEVGKCAICNTGYMLFATDKLCYKFVENCLEMDTTPGICKTCMQNYVLSFTKKSCKSPISNCDLTGHDDNGKCLKCISGFVPTSSGSLCVKAIANCNKYDELGNCFEVKGCSAYDASNICTQCIGNPNIVLSETKKTCQPLIKDCAKQSDTGLCIACADSKTLSDSKKSCKALDSSCTSFNDDGLCTKCLDPIKVPVAAKKDDCPASVDGCSNKCFTKIDNCVTYNAADDSKCLTCAVGFVPSESKCVKSIPQCTTLNANGFCTACIPGFVVADNKLLCVRQIPNCLDGQVSAAGKCLKCNDNFQLNTALGTCIPKDNNCATFGTAGCSVCVNEFVLVGVKCLKNIPNCLEFDENGCKEGKCADGFVLIPETKKCVPVIKDCSAYEATGICKTCGNSKQPTGSGKSCITTIEGCEVYDDNDGKCLGCGSGKAVFNGKDGQKCVTAIANCFNYDEADQALCSVCVELLVPAGDKKTCVDPAAATAPATFSLSLNGDGQLVVYSGTTKLCLAHDLAPDAEGLITFTTPSAVKFIACDSELLEKTLWSFVDPSTGIDFEGEGKDAKKIINKVTGEGSTLKLAIAAKHIAPKGKTISIKSGETTYTAVKLRLHSNGANTMVLALTDFTEFEVAPVATKLGKDMFEPGFSLKFSKNWKVTLGAAAVVGTIAADATAVANQPNYNKYFLYNTGTAYKWDSTTGTNYFDFDQAFAPVNLKDLVDQKIIVSGDLVTIEWTPVTPAANLKDIFPVLQGANKVPTTQISSLCNSRYLESSAIPFQFLYKQGSAKNGKPDPDQLLKIAVYNFPIWKLIECGFIAGAGGTASESTLNGKIGFFKVSDTANDGYFRNIVFQMYTQTATREVRIENMNMFELFKQDIDITKKIIFNSQIRFFKDATLKQEILGPFDDEPRGLLVNNNNIFCELRLVSGNADTNAIKPTNTDPNVEPRLPLMENYKITAVKPYLLKKTQVDGKDAIVKVDAPLVGSIVNTKPNSAVITLNLNNVSPGKYSLLFEYNLLNNRQAGGKRILEEMNQKKSSELKEKNLLDGISSTIDFQYSPPIVEGLNMKKLIFEIGLILCSLMLILA